MTDADVEKHLQAVRRELRVHAWTGPRVEAAFRELEARHQADGPLSARTIRFGALAMAVAAAIALAFFSLRGLVPGASSPQAAGALATHSELLALGAGSEARVISGSRLDVRERTETRVVVALASGTAHFRVKHDPARLFRVEAGSVTVDDRGTAFEVENRGSSVRVSVSEGSVTVSFLEGSTQKNVTLKAGDAGVYPSGAQRVSTAEVARSPLEGAAPASTAPTTSAPERAPAVDWRELARAGKHRGAYDLLAPGGFRDVRDDPSDLLLASDVARLSRHPSDAALLLRKLLSRHERDPRAPSAAFTLGWVLMNELGRPREAAAAFARAEALAPRGNLAEDAVARAVEAWYRAGDRTRAKAEVDRYRKNYPKGRHQAMLERLIEKP